MHRARRTIPPLPSLSPGQYDFYQPRVRFVSIPRTCLSIQGHFEELLAPLLKYAAKNAAKPLKVPQDRMLFPVHELQIPNIIAKFPHVSTMPLEFSVLAPAQASIRLLSHAMATITIINICCLRTLTLPCSPELALKLSIGMKISSALRTISHFTAYAGPLFGRDIVPHLAIDRQVLIIEKEVASAVYCHKDPEIAKHLTAIIRKAYDGEGNGENVVLAATLTESGYRDKAGEEPAVVTALGLDTPDKKLIFLER
jgi:siderophore synthetase component